MKGIRYITDENNQKTAVVIDLKCFKKSTEELEDLWDALVAEHRGNETSRDWEEIRSELLDKPIE